MRVQISAVRDNGSSVLLMLAPTDELLAEQTRIASAIPGQVPIDQLHITLMPSAHSEKSLPPPPPSVEVCRPANLVTHEDKTSAYLRVAEASQLELARYATAVEKALGVSGLQNKERIFHVSLTNLAGPPDRSVANVWEHRSVPV